jgi:hypothetical protein
MNIFRKLIVAGALLCLGSPLYAEAAQAVGPFAGINNTDNSLIIPAERAQDLLNVDITPQGKSVKKRRGYGLQFNLAVTSSAVHGIYNFFDASGNDVSLYFHDRYAQGSVGGATPVTLFSSGTLAATWQCTDSLGLAYCASSSRDPIIKTTGLVATPLAGSPPAGTIVAATPERLIIAGTAANPQRISMSKANDFTTWTVGAAVTDPDTEEITAPGSRITHVTYAFGKIIWFKDASFGAILGTDNSNFQIITISPTIGTLDNTSVYRDGILYFRAQDGHIYGFDGSVPQKLTRDLGATISASSARRANAWLQSTQAEFALGASSPTTSHVSTSISAGDVTVSSFTFTDSTAANFTAGSLSNNTMVVGNSVYLSTSNTNVLSPGFETSGIWTVVSRWVRASGASTGSTCGSMGARTGSFYLQYQGIAANTTTVDAVEENSGSVCGTNTVTYAAASCSFTARTLTMSGCSRKVVRLKMKSSEATGYFVTGSTFVANGSDITYYTNSDNAGGNLITDYDDFTNGASSITTGAYTSQTFDTRTNFNYAGMTPTYSTDDATPAFVLQASTNSTIWTDIGTSSSAINLLGKRYLRYISSFTITGSQDANTALSSMVIFARSSGTYLSNVKNAPSLTSWDTFAVTKADNSGSHTFYMRSSTVTFTVTSTTPTWTAQTAGSVISISTGTYFQVRDDFFIDSSSETPTLNDFTVNWFEGAASDKAYAIYFENSIWWAIASGAGITANNYILRYDLLNSIWTLYDIPMNGMLVRNNSLYFGSATTGAVYKFGDVDNDNSAAINAYWKSKDFFGDTPFTEKELRSLSLSAKSVAGSSMTVTYTTNGSSSTAYTVSLYDANSSFLKSNKNLPLGRNATYFNVKFGNNAADQPFEVFGLYFTFEPKPWRPTP